MSAADAAFGRMAGSLRERIRGGGVPAREGAFEGPLSVDGAEGRRQAAGEVLEPIGESGILMDLVDEAVDAPLRRDAAPEGFRRLLLDLGVAEGMIAGANGKETQG